MTSPLRRKRQITVLKRTATPVNSIGPRKRRATQRFATFCIVALLLTTSVRAQVRTVEEFQQSRFAPPVHIPPRVPLYDPGLPESLNGKFNTTQQIRGTKPFQGQRAVIGDVPADATYHSDQRPGGGLQGKIANLLGSRHAKQPNQPVSNQRIAVQRNPNQRMMQQRAHAQPHPQRAARQVTYQQPASRQSPRLQPQPPPQHVHSEPARSVLQNRLQDSVASAVSLYQPQERAAQPAPRRPATPRQETAQHQHPTVKKSYSVTRPAQGGYLYQQDKTFNGRPEQGNSPYVNIPSQIANQQQPVIRKTAMQEQVNGFEQVNRFEQIDVDRDLPPNVQRVPEISEPWNDSTAFSTHRSMDSNNSQASSQQEFLPTSVDNTDSNPISVMNPPDGGPTLEPETVSNTFESPNPYESSMNYAPASNSLREPVSAPITRRTYQADDNDDFQSGLDADFGTDDDADRQTAIPKKSCEEFRQQLLNRPITDIALDISPPARTDILGENLHRVWRDRNGVELAQGTIADIRRGYVIINSSSGGQIRLPYARLGEPEWKTISDYWILPEQCGLGSAVFAGRNWIPQTVNWHASALCHKPLYFENIQLERYGHSAGPVLQPILSTGHFFERAFFFPYNTAINPPNECQYALGFYRPGDCAPWLKAPFPISLSGATRQAIWFTGFGFLTQ